MGCNRGLSKNQLLSRHRGDGRREDCRSARTRCWHRSGRVLVSRRVGCHTIKALHSKAVRLLSPPNRPWLFLLISTPRQALMPNPSTRLFVCQKCNQPLGIDQSLQDINSAAEDLLLGRRRSSEHKYRQRRARCHIITTYILVSWR